MLNINRFQSMVGISEDEQALMLEYGQKTMEFKDDFIEDLKGWLRDHQIDCQLDNLDEALTALFMVTINHMQFEDFYGQVYPLAVKWYQSGMTQTEVVLLLSRIRQFLIAKSEEMGVIELAHGYCHVVDLVTSIFNTVYLLMEEVRRIKSVVQGELKRFERSFHLLGLKLPKSQVKPYVDHQMWKISVLKLAMGTKTPEQLNFSKDAQQCSLGQWLNAGGLEKVPANQREYFLEAHQRVHELGSRALDDAASHHPEHILNYFTQLELASDELSLVLLNLIEDEFIHLATSDHLTGLPNRRSFDMEFHRQLAFAQRHQMWVGLVIVDIDHFKQINDTYGHLIGDKVLKRLAQVMSEAARTEELPFRWGGEEFALLTMDYQPGGAEALAERIRQSVEETIFCEDEKTPLHVTISAGSLCFKPPLKIPTHEIFAKVDKLLYQAKEAGRNRVIHQTIYQDQEI